MTNPLAGQAGQRKMDAAADAVNRLLEILVLRCSQGELVRDYFQIGILGYGYARQLSYEEVIAGGRITQRDENENAIGYQEATDYDPETDGPIYGASTVRSLLPDATEDWPFLSISAIADCAEIAARSVRVSDGSGGTVEVTRNMPVWLEPYAGMQTPMRQAFTHAERAVEQWISQRPDSFPPMVINVSDGEATDGDPEPLARSLMNRSTSDGNVLLFNCHLSDTATAPMQYPDREGTLPNAYARQMFRMSSTMPPPCMAHAALLGVPVGELSRCCVFNADMVSLVQFLDIGTRGPSNLH